MENVRVTFMSFIGETALALQSTGSIWELGVWGRTLKPFRSRICEQFREAFPVRLLAATLAHRFAITEGNRLFFAEGNSNPKQLVENPTLDVAKVIDMKLTRGSILMLLNNGTLESSIYTNCAHLLSKRANI
jgi:hypothetical protein